MEASEKPQLPLENLGSVRVLGDRIAIENLTITDAQTARVVRDRVSDGADAAGTVAKAIEIGARVLESESAAANVDFVNNQFERHMGGLAEQLSQALELGNEELAEHLANAFGADRSDSIQQQIREMLIKAGEHQRTEMLKLFTAEDAANPLADFKTSVTAKVADAATRSERQAETLREQHAQESKEMREQVAALKTEVARLTERREGDAALAEAEDAGTRKGRSFEEKVNDALEQIAATRGDAALAVGDAANESGSKKGDTLVEVDGGSGKPSCRIVFEAKNRKLGKPDAWRELNSALAERDAGYAVLVVADGKVPPKTQTLHEYEGNKMIVAVDADDPEVIVLEAAYRLARARLLSTGESELDVDAAGVRAAAEDALMALKDRQKILKTLTAAVGNVESAQETIEGMTDRVRERLEQVERLISAAADEAEGLSP